MFEYNLFFYYKQSYHVVLLSVPQTGFELTFFKRITSEDKALFVPIPAHWLRDVGTVSHFAVTDLHKRRFTYKTIHNLFRTWRADPDDYQVAIDEWSARKENGAHLLSASMKDYRIDLSVVGGGADEAHYDEFAGMRDHGRKKPFCGRGGVG